MQSDCGMKIDIHKSVEIEPTIRTELLSSMFEVPASTKLSVSLTGEIPLGVNSEQPWNIGLIVGPSGSGKTLLLEEFFGRPRGFLWNSKSVIDDFDKNLSMEEISRVCQCVGFNTIPSWMRPYTALSNGERFRVEVARYLVSDPLNQNCLSDVIRIDEFTSVVDRQVAQFACHGIQKYVRDNKKHLVVASCHYDILDWLQPDWILEPGNPCRFTWRSLQPRPSITVSVSRVKYETWQLFKDFHYMSQDLNKAARCYGLYVKSSDTTGLESGLPDDEVRPRIHRGGDNLRDGSRPRISSELDKEQEGNSGMVLHSDNRPESKFSSTATGSPDPSEYSGSRNSRDHSKSQRSDATNESGDKLSKTKIGRVRTEEETTNVSEQTSSGYEPDETASSEASLSVLQQPVSNQQIGVVSLRRPSSTGEAYRIASLCGVLYRPHPRVSDIYGFTRMVTLPDFQGLGLAFVLACKVASAYKALGKRLHSYPNHPAWIRSYQRSRDWMQVKQSGVYSPKRGISSTVEGFGGRRCAVFQYIGDAMNREEAERLINVDTTE